MTDYLKAFAVFGAILALVCCLVFGTAYFSRTVLPLPPDFTSAEMNQRIEDFGAAHMAACTTCKIAAETPNLPAPRCYDVARTQALVVGDWVAIGCKSERVMLWQYVGRPINGFRWSTIIQCWKPLRRIPRCPS